jgi:hypothetical protein
MITETNIISPNSVALISIHDSPFAYNARNTGLFGATKERKIDPRACVC